MCDLLLLPLLVRFDSPTTTFTLRTKPSSSLSVSNTRAKDHRFLGTLSSLITTTSLTSKFLVGLCHFCLSCKECKNSFLHRDQYSLLKCWTRLQCFRKYLPVAWNTPGGGRITLLFIVKTWFGVNSSKESGENKLWMVSGRLLTIASSSHLNVRSDSSLTWLHHYREVS